MNERRQIRQNQALAELASRDSFSAHSENDAPPAESLLASTYSSSQKLLRHPDLRAELFPAAQLQAYADSPIELELIGCEMKAGHCVKQKTDDEARARKVIALACSRTVAKQIKPFVECIANELLNKADRHFDVVGDYGALIPDLVLCHLLGMPPKDRPKLRGWAEDLSRVADSDPHLVSRASQVTLQIRAHIGRVQSRRLEEHGDGFGALAHCADQFSVEDVTNGITVMLAAGNETVQDLIANTVLILVENRELEQQVRKEPELVNALIEETLRLESPVQSTERVAPFGVNAAGRSLNAWQRITVHLAAANRDPSVFRQPNSVDLQHQRNPHVAFGLGANRCPAAALARMEARIAIAALLRRTRELKLIDSPVRKPPGILHGLKSLIIGFQS